MGNRTLYRIICGVLLGNVLSVGHAFAAENEFKPFLAVTGEYTDNVLETAGARRHDFISRVQPGFTSRYQAPFWNWDVAYNFDYHHYARNSRGDETTHNAAAKGSVALVENFLYLDLGDTFRRVSLDVARDTTTQGLFVNQSDQNVANLSPYLIWRPTATSSLKAGYRYTDTRYWDAAGIDKHEHNAFADFNYEITSKFSVSAGYAFARLEARPAGYDRHDAYGGVRFEYADKSYLFGKAGNSWQQFRHGSGVSYLFWNAGVTHDLGVAVATLETRVQNTEDPLAVSTRETSYSARLEKAFERGQLAIFTGYSDFENTEKNTLEKTKASLGMNGRFEVFPGLNATLALTAERFSRKQESDYPYRFSGVSGLSYAFNNDLTLAINYSYITNLHNMDSANDAVVINRVVLEIKKAF